MEVRQQPTDARLQPDGLQRLRHQHGSLTAQSFPSLLSPAVSLSCA